MKYNISIIIVSWNAKVYLEQCLFSIIKATAFLESVEIVVVDNSSTDGSAEMVRQKFPNVTLICNSSNLGFAKANNIGINHCHGDYLFFINSDVVVYPDCIISIVNYMEEHPDIGLLGPRIIGTDNRVQRSCMGYPSLWNTFCRAVFLDKVFPRIKIFNGFMLNHWAHDSIKEVDIINGCFWAVRRKAIEQIGLLDEDFFIYAEDMDWCKRFNNADWKVVYFPLAQSLHYGGASSANAPVKFYVEMQKANLKYWKKYYGGLSCRMYSCIVILHHSLRMAGSFFHYLLVPSKRNISAYKTNRSIATLLYLIRR